MKILDLFNEYNLSPDMTGGEMEQPRTEKDWNTMSRMDKAYIVSKDFGWIKRLVDNDKIKLGAYDVEGYHFNIHTYLDLIMLLAISDTPIDDLFSYLK